MKLLPTTLLHFLQDRRLWVLAAIIFAGRMLWFVYWGVLLEIDSLGYLELQANLSHPPLYSVFNAILLRLVDSLEIVVVGQALLYAWAASLFLRRHVADGKWATGLAIALALEPLSGKLCSTVMAETLFLSLLLLIFAALPSLLGTQRRHWITTALLIGGLLGLAYLTRYAAPVFGVAIGLWLMGQRLGLRKLLLTALLMLIGFQAAILPLRAYYRANFGTWQFNGFSGLSVWNTAAYLYPDTDLPADNDFERFLGTMPRDKFALYETWHTNQIFHDSCAYERYTRGMDTAGKLAAARAAGSLGWRLLSGAPTRHITNFVWPNVQRPFTKTDTLYADLLPPLIDHGLHYQPHQIHIYHPSWWWIAFSVLILATSLHAARRRHSPAIVGALLISCWLYLAGIAVLTVIFLRFVYLLGPLLVLALGLASIRSTHSTTNS